MLVIIASIKELIWQIWSWNLKDDGRKKEIGCCYTVHLNTSVSPEEVMYYWADWSAEFFQNHSDYKQACYQLCYSCVHDPSCIIIFAYSLESRKATIVRKPVDCKTDLNLWQTSYWKLYFLPLKHKNIENWCQKKTPVIHWVWLVFCLFVFVLFLMYRMYLLFFVIRKMLGLRARLV